MSVQLAQLIEELPDAPIEVLGQLDGAGIFAILSSAVWRKVENAGNETSDALPLLTSIEEVHALNREEAQAGYPVRVRGVVTWATGSAGLALQDATRGVWVPGLAADSDDGSLLRVGDYVEVEGVTDPGEFSRVIRCKHARRLGLGCLPDPALPTWEQLINGSMDNQFIEIEGLVTQVTNTLNNEQTPVSTVVLLLPGGVLNVQLPDLSLSTLNKYTNAHVRIRGSMNAMFNDDTHLMTAGSIVIWAPMICLADPFTTLSKRIGELQEFDARAGGFHRVKISGQILHARQSEYFLTDGANGLRFITKDAADLKAGDQVEVVGFSKLDGPSPVLREASARKTGEAPLPRVRTIASESLLSGSNDAALVEVESRLLSLRSNQTETVLDLQTGSRSFSTASTSPQA